MTSMTDNNHYAKNALKEHVENRKDISSSYLGNSFYIILAKYCCCLQSCCYRSKRIKRGAMRY